MNAQGHERANRPRQAPCECKHPRHGGKPCWLHALERNGKFICGVCRVHHDQPAERALDATATPKEA